MQRNRKLAAAVSQGWVLSEKKWVPGATVPEGEREAQGGRVHSQTPRSAAADPGSPLLPGVRAEPGCSESGSILFS